MKALFFSIVALLTVPVVNYQMEGMKLEVFLCLQIKNKLEKMILMNRNKLMVGYFHA